MADVITVKDANTIQVASGAEVYTASKENILDTIAYHQKEVDRFTVYAQMLGLM